MSIEERKLPEGWKWATLGDVADYHNGRAFKPEEWSTTGTPIIRIQNLNTPSAAYNYFLGEIDPRNAVDDGDLLISWSASLDAFLWNRGPAVLNQHIFKVEEYEDKIGRHYLYFAVREAMTEIRGQVHGATMRHITKPEFEATRIPLPPLPEQKRIAAILKDKLEAVEKARAAAEARLEAAKALQSSYLREVFESDEAKKWQRKKLGEVALLIQNGIYKPSENYGHGHPFVRMYNIPNASWNLNLAPLAQVFLEESELDKFRLQSGDILISRVNSFELVGKSAFVGPEADGYVFENMLIRIRFNDSIDSMFVSQQMSTTFIRAQIEKVAKRAIGQSSINSNDIRKIEVAFPPLVEQTRIAIMLNEKAKHIDLLSKELTDEFETIKSLPSALLRKAFNGEL